ncbi:MAG: spermidine synthase [Actinobacteria bacterium]|uniref:Unannotated protein n=1 Tax=freshwater metagenome TaxID=449393 RepID=A0A6J6RY44_9ZZZZ|nr:spermidine synthase [Actinomycetota bacterium]
MSIEILAADGPDAWLVRIDGRDQSYVDLADPTRLAFDYVRRMGDVIDAHAQPGAPLRVVHVGGAGLTLPRYVAATRPRSSQVVLEPFEALTDQVRRELPLPRHSGIRVRPVDGRSGLAALRDGEADLIVIDAYVDARVPDDLVTVEALADTARVLARSGRCLVNLSDRAPFAHTRDVVAGARNVFEHVAIGAEPATLRARRPGNLLLVAGHDSGPADDLARRASTSASPYRVLSGTALTDSFGGGHLLHDDR